MKQFLTAALFALLFSSCSSQPAQQNSCDHTVCKSFLEAKDSQVVYYKQQYELIELQKDSMKTKLFLANYKVEKVKYYLAIVHRKPEQKKYLVGWITRAVE